MEINFIYIRDRMLQSWRTLAAFAVIGVFLSIFMLSFQRPVYSVRMTVVPTPSAQSSFAAGGTGSALGSLFNLGITQSSSDYVRYQRLLHSTVVAERLARNYGMLQYVFSNAWNKETKSWQQPPTTRASLLGWLFDIAHVPIWSPPDISALAAFLEGSIQIMPSTQTDIVGISMDSSNPEFARRILLLAHQEANEVLRHQVEVRAKEKAAYLRERLNQTNVEDYRQTLLTLLSTEEKTLMVTQTSNEFAAEILSPPTQSATPLSPRPVMSVVVGFVIGIILGSAVTILFGPHWLSGVRAWLSQRGLRRRKTA